MHGYTPTTHMYACVHHMNSKRCCFGLAEGFKHGRNMILNAPNAALQKRAQTWPRDGPEWSQHGPNANYLTIAPEQFQGDRKLGPPNEFNNMETLMPQ